MHLVMPIGRTVKSLRTDNIVKQSTVYFWCIFNFQLHCGIHISASIKR